MDGGALPPGNLVSAVIALETNRDRARLPALLELRRIAGFESASSVAFRAYLLRAVCSPASPTRLAAASEGNPIARRQAAPPAG